jgi:UDP:flavonoid glycosyltransferase YjiC (YdhE family)
MRVQFVVWGWPTHMFHIVPLAWACRAAGHEVTVLTQPNVVPAVRGAGLTAVPVGTPVDVEEMRRGRRYLAAPDPSRPLEWPDLRRYGTWNVAPYLVIASKMLADGVQFTRRWRPDLIVFEATSYAGPIISAMTGIPAVRHTWGVDYPYLFEEFTAEAFAPFRDALKVDRIETLGAATVDTCPPSMQIEIADGTPRLPMTFVPYNGAAAGFSARWCRLPRSRPRVVVCWGVTISTVYQGMSHLRGVLDALGELDADVVAATGDPGQLEGLPDNVRVVGGMALHDLLHDADLFVCQGGMGNIMTALRAAVPTLVVPGMPDQVFNGRRFAATGAARCVEFDPGRPHEILRHTREMLAEPGYAAAAATLRAESDAMPSAADVVPELVRIAHAR